MKVLIAASAGWIVFSLVDQAVFNGRIVSGLPNLARAIRPGLISEIDVTDPDGD